jgi:hypothetical protein
MRLLTSILLNGYPKKSFTAEFAEKRIIQLFLKSYLDKFTDIEL